MKVMKGFFIFTFFCTVAVFAESADVAQKDELQKKALHLDWMNTKISPAKTFTPMPMVPGKKTIPFLRIILLGVLSISSHEKVQEIVHQILIKASQDTKANPKAVLHKWWVIFTTVVWMKPISTNGHLAIEARI